MRKGEYLYFTGIGLHHRGRWYFDNEKAATRRQDISCMGCSHMRYSYMLCSMARILGAILFNPEFAESQRSSCPLPYHRDQHILHKEDLEKEKPHSKGRKKIIRHFPYVFESRLNKLCL